MKKRVYIIERICMLSKKYKDNKRRSKMKYTLYNIDNSQKSSVRGLWLDNGKVYKDSITLVKYTRKDKLTEGIKALFASGQEAVFYTKGQGGYRGYCIYKNGKRQV